MRYIGIFVVVAALFWLLVWHARRPRREGLTGGSDTTAHPIFTTKKIQDLTAQVQKGTANMRQTYGFEDSADTAAVKSYLSAKKEFIECLRAASAAYLTVNDISGGQSAQMAANFTEWEAMLNAIHDAEQYIDGGGEGGGDSGGGGTSGKRGGDSSGADDDKGSDGDSKKKSGWF